MKTIHPAFAALVLVPMFATACASSLPRSQARVSWAIAPEHPDEDVLPETSTNTEIGVLDERLAKDLEQHFVLHEHVPAALPFHCVDADGLPTCAAKPATDDAVAAPSHPDFVLTTDNASAR